MNEFVHLHLHTEFSLLDGACRIDELLDEAVKLKMPALAVTEHGNMFSSVVFHDHARDRGLKPILGCEVYVASGSRFDKTGSQTETNHLVLLAETNEGYKNLIKLVSAGYTEGFYYKPRIDRDLLAQHAKGLIGLSSCLKGEVASALKVEQARPALEAAGRLRDILGQDNFFLEMQYQGLEEQKIVNRGILPLARELNLPLVATNDVHYLRQGDSQPHDILLCIGTGKSVNDAQRLRYTGDQFFLKTADQMAVVFKDHLDALRNTVRIAERCDVTIPKGQNHLPTFGVPEGFTLESYFEHVARKGFAERLPRLQHLASVGALRHSIDEYERRLDYEIEMIKQMGYQGYFLIVWDFIRYAREEGIPVGPGRGSAAGSLVAWCMRITDVDPIDFDLIFERFLNPERVSLPDIDVDFCERRRGEVIDYVTRKYGRENVAQIITFGTMKAKAVVRDVGRALDMPYADVDRIAKQIPPALDMTLDKALAENPVLKDMAAKDPRVKEVIDIGRRLEGMSRHASVHAAGVVIAPGPITDYAPLYKGQRDEITTQWNMKEVERVGLLKMDFLGLSTLTLIQDCLREIERTEGVALDIDTIPLDDPKAYKLFAEGAAHGIFQFESSGMRELLRKARPERLDDLIALNALYRPGPLQSGMVDDFIARKQGRTKIKYELPQLEPILSDTYGVIAYQEQVMRIAQALGQFTLGQADVLRKAMGKKDPKVMAKQREAFMEGARKQKLDEAKAEKIFDLMEHFAGYGFNKSHSTAYAYLAYQTAYLKPNYPKHFAAALLTIEAQNTDKLAVYMAECRDRGIPVLPPDVNRSQLNFSVDKEREAVRFGLTAIKGLGEGAINAILAARRALGGRIPSLHALCDSLDLRLVNRRVFEALVKSGACDSLIPLEPGQEELTPGDLALGRARLFAAIDAAVDHGARQQRNRELGQVDLFGGDERENGPTHSALPTATPWTEIERLGFEKDTLGLYLSGHPLDRYSEDLRIYGAKTTTDLSARPAVDEGIDGEVPAPSGPPPASDRKGKAGEDVSMGGIVTGLRPLTTKSKGERMCVFVLDDAGGSIEVVVFPEAFKQYGHNVESGQLVLVVGRWERDDESSRILATEVHPISVVSERLARRVRVAITTPPHNRQTFERLWDIFSRHKGDRPVAFAVEVRETERPVKLTVDVNSQIRVRPSEALVADIEAVCGTGSVTLRSGEPMPIDTLDFEEPVAVLLKEVEALSMLPVTDERQREIEGLLQRATSIRAEIFTRLTPWQRVQVARHPNRPNLLDYAERLFSEFTEISGDRRFADDHAMVTGLARYKGEPVLVVGHHKGGGDTKQKIYRNFGYAKPEGYRKAMRAMKLAEKFSRPVIAFIDTPAAYPGVESEERGIAEAIAVNLRDMAVLDVPIIVVVHGEGGSGGALGIAVGDRVVMSEFAVYSVIPPEGCAAILWRNANKKVEAAEALKMTAPDLLRLGLVDTIVPEPVGGAHNDPDLAAEMMDAVLAPALDAVAGLDSATRLEQRYQKFRSMGQVGLVER